MFFSCIIYNKSIKMLGFFLMAFALGVLYLVTLNRNSSKYNNYPPGPLNLPFVGGAYVLGSEPHKRLIELKQKYGKVIALNFGSYRGIVVSDYETIRKAFSQPEVQSRPKFEATLKIRGEDRAGIIWSTGKTHEEQRAFMSKTMKNFGLGTKKMGVLLQEQLKILCETFDKQVGEVIINVDLFNTIAIGALWMIISGESGKEEDESFKALLTTTRRVSAGATPVVYFFPKLAQIFPNFSGWNNMVQSISAQNVFVTKAIDSHKEFLKEGNEDPRHIIDAYLQKIGTTRDIASTFYGINGDQNLMATVADLLLAGTETVSTALTWLLALLIHHPEIQNKSQDEIDKVIGPDRLPCLTDRPQLPYIEAVMFEVLRYSSLAPMAIPHETSGQVEIGGYTIPKHTIVIANMYDVLHDPKTWDEPEQFLPERFLNEDGSEIIRDLANRVDLMFGHGKRLCSGIALAKDELFLFITGVCQRYTFVKDPNSHYESQINVHCGSTIVPTPHNLIIRKR